MDLLPPFVDVFFFRRPRSADLRVPNDIKDESMHNEDTHAEKYVNVLY